MPRDAVSRTANVERNGGHKWVKGVPAMKEVTVGRCIPFELIYLFIYFIYLLSLFIKCNISLQAIYEN